MITKIRRHLLFLNFYQMLKNLCRITVKLFLFFFFFYYKFNLKQFTLKIILIRILPIELLRVHIIILQKKLILAMEQKLSAVIIFLEKMHS